MLRSTRSRLIAAGLAILVIASGLFAWSRAEARWRPHTIVADASRLGALLQGAGWVSPGVGTRPLYMISFRSCPDCIRLEAEQFPALRRAGVEPRVIVVARRRKSTAAERSGVAELWAHRDWKSYEAWTSMPVAAWTAAGLPSGDTDPARAALVERGRAFSDAVEPILRENGVSERLHYPTLLWRDAQGRWRGCNCEDPRTYRSLRQELGVAG